jgi:hypothetical protein
MQDEILPIVSTKGQPAEKIKLYRHQERSQSGSIANRRHFQWRKKIFTTIPSQEFPTKLKDQRLPCREHLDPYKKFWPTSHWVHLDGSLPSTSLDEVVQSIENILYEDLVRGRVVDLDAMWSPFQDKIVRTIPWIHEKHNKHGNHDEDNTVTSRHESRHHSAEELLPNRVQAAHVVLSPFGRPTGWHLKLANASMVHVLLARAASQQPIRVGWKTTLVKEYHPNGGDSCGNNYETKHHQNINRKNAAITSTNTVDGFLVDDTMVRVENCPSDITEDYLRYLLSRYELARFGPTVIPWKGITPDGKRQHMFVVRFHSAAWARAAIREMQDMPVSGPKVTTAARQTQDVEMSERRLRLMQYPKQRLLD